MFLSLLIKNQNINSFLLHEEDLEKINAIILKINKNIDTFLEK